MQKYKLSWRDLKLNDFKVYLFALFKAFIPKKKIKNLDELENFIQTKSAWVTQVTLYSYLKTRMGTRYVLHFDNDVFMSSLNIANAYHGSSQTLLSIRPSLGLAMQANIVMRLIYPSPGRPGLI